MYRYFKFILLSALLAGCSSAGSLQETGKTGEPSTHKQPLVQEYQQPSPDDSGMWLLPQINGPVHAELVAKGLQLSSEVLYHAESPSLNQAIVRIDIGQSGGGTGSFVSPEGLVLTNHHVAYDAIAAASSASQNYLDDGFYAESYGNEIQAQDYMLYIPIEQVEVTQQINRNIPDTLDARERMLRDQQVRNALIQQRKSGDNDIIVEIHDYWAGNCQMMSVYKVIRDVRLVYAPPSSIGKFGGDIDNWQWPRHTGDFAFLRAYVAPDGSSRSHHPENVPFTPARHLSIDASGVQPGDFTMVMGFPGQTFRYESSHAFEFYEKVRNPILIQSFEAILSSLELAAKQDPDLAVNTASERASLANSLKYFRGVQNGFEKYQIIKQKRNQETAFEKWFLRDSLKIARYRQVLPQLDQAYEIASQTGDLLYSTLYSLNYSTLLQLGGLYSPYFEYLQNPDSLGFTQGEKDSLLNRHQAVLESTDLEAENMMLEKLLYMLSRLPDGKVPFYLMELWGEAGNDTLKQSISDFLEEQRKQSVIYDVDRAQAFLELPPKQASEKLPDKMVKLFEAIREAFLFSRDNYVKHFSYLEPAHKLYVDGMLSMRNDSTEYPDANSTLRLSGGRIHGYSPADGVYYTPFTSFSGMIAKDTDKEPFDAPQALEDLYDSFQSSDSTGGQIIVNFLSTNDITGGNSGSPVLNGKGEIVGIAFDSNIEGVVGDYFYDPALNRTISVDIRYVIFLLNNYADTDRLIEELDITGFN